MVDFRYFNIFIRIFKTCPLLRKLNKNSVMWQTFYGFIIGIICVLANWKEIAMVRWCRKIKSQEYRSELSSRSLQRAHSKRLEKNEQGRTTAERPITWEFQTYNIVSYNIITYLIMSVYNTYFLGTGSVKSRPD